jgi:hypothetical protein
MDGTDEGASGRPGTSGDVHGATYRLRPDPRLRVAVLAAVVIAGALLAALVVGRPGRDPEVVLDAARAAMVEATSHRFVVRSVHTDDGTIVARRRVEGSVVDPGTWRVEAADADGRRVEAVEADGTRYVRTPALLDGDAPWLVEDPTPRPEPSPEASRIEWAGDTVDVPGERARAGLRLHLATIGDPGRTLEPTTVARLVQEATEPRLVDDGAGGVTLRASLPPAVPTDPAGAPLPTTSVEIVLDRDDRPRRVRAVAVESGVRLAVEAHFADWAAALDVVPPPEDEVDRTPWVDERRLAAVPPGLLLVPSFLPDELVLRRATVLQPADDGDCPVVTLAFEPADAAGGGTVAGAPYLWVNSYPAGCDDAVGLGSSGDFDEALGGLPARRDWAWEVRLADVVVSLDGTATDGELAQVAGSLRPVEAADLVDAVVAPG